MTELKNKSVLVLGLGITGLSMVRWLVGHGAQVRAADSRNAPPALEQLRTEFPQVELHCEVFRSELLDGIDFVASSPGVGLTDPLLVLAQQRGIPVVGDIELFAQALPKENRPKLVAITGSNGKTTVTSMVGAMCRAAGIDAVVAGNIFPAVLDVMLQRAEQPPQVWILELSSFQLETTHTLSADVATVLNVSEDHLDRYDDMGKYMAAKARIFRNEGQDGVQVLNRDDAESLAMGLLGRRVVTFGMGEPPRSDDWGIEQDEATTWLVRGRERMLHTGELQVVGQHNIANALAALALCDVAGLPLPQLLDGLRKFKGLAHRVEHVAAIAGVDYYDDSKGTNVGAAVAALRGLVRPVVLIAGGDGKGQDFTPLKPAVADHARAVVLIGRDAEQIAEALDGSDVPLLVAEDMADAVRLAADEAQVGDAVLLSPACASFDMFRNYIHRAEVYVEAVRGMQRGGNA